jgi:hypothetical protein
MTFLMTSKRGENSMKPKWICTLVFCCAPVTSAVLAQTRADKVIAACENCFEQNKSDCSGFARCVGDTVHITMTGDANAIITSFSASGSKWKELTDGKQAADKAASGWLVIGCLPGRLHTPPEAHGHLVVVVRGPLKDDKYPTAYWGRLHGVGCKATFETKAWKLVDLPKVTYFGQPLP